MNQTERDQAVQEQDDRPLAERVAESDRARAMFALAEFRETGNPLFAIIAISAWSADQPLDPDLMAYLKGAFGEIGKLAESTALRSLYEDKIKRSRSQPDRLRFRQMIKDLGAKTPKEAGKAVARALGLAGPVSGASNAFEARWLRLRRRYAVIEMEQRRPLWDADKRLRGAIADEMGVSDKTVKRWLEEERRTT